MVTTGNQRSASLLVVQIAARDNLTAPIIPKWVPANESKHNLKFNFLFYHVRHTPQRMVAQSFDCFFIRTYIYFSVSCSAVFHAAQPQTPVQSQWNEPWSRKYTRKSTCLPLSQVQRLGRQILEALLFLRERGIPSHGHLHSGNVILQNGVAR